MASSRVSPEAVRILFRERSYLVDKLPLEFVKLELERDRLDDLIESGLSVGMTYSEIMSMNRKRFNTVYRGKLKYLELQLNQQLVLNKNLVIKLSQAFSNNINDFNDDDYISLTPDRTVDIVAKQANDNNIKLEVLKENIVRGEEN